MLFSNSQFLRPLSRIPNPMATIGYMENVGLFAHLAYPLGSAGRECGSSAFRGSVVRGWHGAPGEEAAWRFNVSYADGHAAAVKIQGFANPQLSEYPGDGTGPPEHDIWQCVIVRGEKWQRDCLPSPPIELGFAPPSGDEQASAGAKRAGRERKKYWQQPLMQWYDPRIE
jgi:prepilin-type processing-associated H-X9-DG protein